MYLFCASMHHVTIFAHNHWLEAVPCLLAGGQKLSKKYMRFLILLFLTLTFSCRTSREEKEPFSATFALDDCQKLIDLLKESWGKNELGYFFFKKLPKDIDKVYYSKYMENCLMGKTKKEIKMLFGSSSAQYNNSFYYYMSEQCLQGNPPNNFSNRCIILIIQFDDSNKVSHIPAILPYQGPIY